MSPFAWEALLHWSAVALYIAGTMGFAYALLFAHPEKVRVVQWITAAGLLPHSAGLVLRYFHVGHGPYMVKYEVLSSNAWIVLALFLALGEKQGVDPSTFNVVLQNDILKEYIAQKEFIFPPRPSMRLVTDTIEFAAQRAPRFNPISISGYHMREAGATAAQEVGFTLANALEYVGRALGAGIALLVGHDLEVEAARVAVRDLAALEDDELEQLVEAGAKVRHQYSSRAA